MALTITKRSEGVSGSRRLIVADVQFDSSYPTGGEAFAPADLGMNSFEAVLPQTPTTATRFVTFDYANSKLMVYTALSTQAGSSSDQSSVTTTVLAIGK